VSHPLHIVFFNRAFYPEESATSGLLTELAEGLVQEYGCNVTVVAGYPQGRFSSPWSPLRGWGLILREGWHGIRILRVRGTRFSKRRFLGRAINYLSYFLLACLAILRLNKANVIVALTDPPIVGLAALMAARRFRCPLVVSYRDLFPEVGRLIEDFRHPWVDRLLTQVNRILISNTDRLIALGEDMKMRLCQEKGAQPERVVVIPDWADGEVIRPVLKENPFSIQHELADRFVVMHAGNLGLSQNLEILIEAASMLKDLTDLLVVFLGDGVKRSALEEQVRHLGLSNVRFFPYQPKDRVALAFGSADCFVILLKPGLSGYITPSKLYGILAAGRPYVASIDPTSDVARITEQYRCGVVVPAGDPKALADALRRLYHDRKEAQLMGKRAREAFASYDRSVGVKKYHTLFSELVAHHGR